MDGRLYIKSFSMRSTCVRTIRRQQYRFLSMNITLSADNPLTRTAAACQGLLWTVSWPFLHEGSSSPLVHPARQELEP